MTTVDEYIAGFPADVQQWLRHPAALRARSASHSMKGRRNR